MYEIQKNDALLNSNAQKPKWIWHEFIKEKSINILVAQQSRGKSQLALQLVTGLMKSKPNDRTLLDASLCRKKVKVLYVSSEMNESLVFRRFKEMGGTRCQRWKECFAIVYAPTLEMERLKYYIQAEKPDLVIVDIFDSLLKSNGYDINSYADINACAARLKVFDTAFLLIHHMNKNGTSMGSVGTLSAMDTRMEMLETFRDEEDGQMAIHQEIHVYGKSVKDRIVNVKFIYPKFEIEYSDADEEELDKPVGRLMEKVIGRYSDNHNNEDDDYPEDAHVIGTFQEVAAELGMIDKYQFSPKRMASLLALNREVLEKNFVFFKTKRKSKCMVMDIWYDPSCQEKSVFKKEKEEE